MNSTFVTHPSVRIKGTETNYIPRPCFDPGCVDKAPHMHCPFCVKTESYTDPVILKAHYRVKHVDKGIEFSGLKVLRCCDRCDIVGVIKGEKKFKGAHWHCYKCRNGFNRRDEAIKHYKTHFRNPHTTFQIQIVQDINQPVNQSFETEEAASCIPTDSFSVSAGLSDNVCQTSLPVLHQGLEGMVAMSGVGAVETVGVADTQTIMIIQEDGNFSTMHELTTSQDIHTSEGIGRTNPVINVEVEEPDRQETIQELREKIIQLEREKAEQRNHITLLNKKIEEQAEQLENYKLVEQDLMEQIHQLQLQLQSNTEDPNIVELCNSNGTERAIQDLCSQLETQHKQLIRQQITQLKHSLVQTNPVQPKMIVLNAHTLGGQLGHTVSLQAYTSDTNSATPTDVTLDFSTGEGSVIEDDIVEHSNEDVTKVSEVDKVDSYDKEETYNTILVHSLSEDLEHEPVIENDGSISHCEPPPEKKMKNK
ncbi:hypothetical protein ACF0H5_017889 [Mactra antiquata]